MSATHVRWQYVRGASFEVDGPRKKELRRLLVPKTKISTLSHRMFDVYMKYVWSIKCIRKNNYTDYV